MVRLTDSALREAGWDALVKKLGVAGALRFLRESRIGEGDYTKIHQAWATSISRKELFELVEKARAGRKKTGRLQKKPARRNRRS
jgi:hypothetical protein